MNILYKLYAWWKSKRQERYVRSLRNEYFPGIEAWRTITSADVIKNNVRKQ